MEEPQRVKTTLLDIQEIGTDYQKLFISMIPLGWIHVLKDCEVEIGIAGKTLTRLVKEQKHRIVPEPWNIFRAFQLTPWWEVKVVIIGQDPYHLMHGSQPSATGACFECAPGMPIRHSLEQLFTRLTATVEGFTEPQSGDLTKWMQQGVLLLNSALTTNANQPGAHLGVWSFFPIKILQFLSKSRKNIVYMTWGRESQKFQKYIEGENLILEASHPAARGYANSFNKMNHFNECNEYLVKHKIPPIDWCL